jgi:integrase/recombinase XerD
MTLPLELTPDNPAVVYLESLSPGSYWAVRHSLETIAEILAGEDADPWTFPWHELRYQHTARVRRELVQRYAPATVNKMLSARKSSPRPVRPSLDGSMLPQVAGPAVGPAQLWRS